eukprot:TRINITY_DN6047_c0_g1_i1.p1 TRINITY_DN6047_c0_g1~~TRINITY_DN6047_c0_g1_i1.p1  ORF type:complete len:294 (+),score=73.51 TRINITY_DN6047_c0_g1_i1:51-884(+)
MELMGLQMAWPDLEVSYGVGLLWFALLHACYRTVLRFVVPGYERFPDARKWEWANRVVAMLVCVSMSICMAWYWFTKGELTWDDASSVPLFEDRCMKFMVGYLLYDLVICVFVESEITVLFLVHHIIGLVSHMLVLLTGDGIGSFYTMAVYISEGSTPFMHAAWMLNELRLQENKKSAAFWCSGLPDLLFKLTSLLLLTSFFVLRAVLSPYVAYHSIVVGLPAWTQSLNREIGVLQAGIIFTFMCINVYWFLELVKLAIKNFAGGGGGGDAPAKKDQ